MLHGQITLDRSVKEKQVSAKPFQGKSGYLLETVLVLCGKTIVDFQNY